MEPVWLRPNWRGPSGVMPHSLGGPTLSSKSAAPLKRRPDPTEDARQWGSVSARKLVVGLPHYPKIGRIDIRSRGVAVSCMIDEERAIDRLPLKCPKFA